MKKKSYKLRTTVRIEAPRAGLDAKGKPALMCPFCNPSHPLIPGRPSACGTDIQMRAVQTVYRAKFMQGMTCAKCGQGGGEMVRWNDAFVHTHDCTPGVATFLTPPPFSAFAKLVSSMPESMQKLITRYTGKPVPVDEVQPDGKRTGKVLGYFFLKSKGGTDAQRTQVST